MDLGHFFCFFFLLNAPLIDKTARRRRNSAVVFAVYSCDGGGNRKQLHGTVCVFTASQFFKGHAGGGGVLPTSSPFLGLAVFSFETSPGLKQKLASASPSAVAPEPACGFWPLGHDKKWFYFFVS